eukprot:g2993.t1
MADEQQPMETEQPEKVEEAPATTEEATKEVAPEEKAPEEQKVVKEEPKEEAAPVVNSSEPQERVTDNVVEQPKLEMSSLPIRAYLDQTVVPVLLTGMSALVKERPADPIEWLAKYLLEKKNKQ